MNHFYIKKIIVSGIGHEPSSVEFIDGLNLVVGPSNTGKSHIMKCVDYLFGFSDTAKHPFSFNNKWGYTDIEIVLETSKGTVILTRKIGEKNIYVSGSNESIRPGVYNIGSGKNSINTIWLKLVGIEDNHQILSKKTGETQSLTWRSMMHLFFVAQADMARTSSVLLNPKTITPTPSQAALLFLLTGQDAIKPPKKESKETKEARKDEVIQFIRTTLQRIDERIEKLEKEQENYILPDINGSVAEVYSEIDRIQAEIDESISESKSLMNRIYEHNGRISELNTILKSFDVLRNQYEVDIDRLAFIVDGESHLSNAGMLSHCPICNGVLPPEQKLSYSAAARVDLEHIASHLHELQKAYADTLEQREKTTSVVAALEKQRKEVDDYIRITLSPQLDSLKNLLAAYKLSIQHAQELATIKSEKTLYEADLYAWEHKEIDVEKESIDLSDAYTFDIIKKLNEKVSSILKFIHFPGYSSVRFDWDTFDFTIQDMPKDATNGGGYSSVLNAVELLALREVLHEFGKNEIGILLLDSALTQLSESVYSEKGNIIRDSLIRYMLTHQAIGQIIIVEQRDKMPDWIMTTKECNIIEFTKSKDIGIYGFLNDVYEEND